MLEQALEQLSAAGVSIRRMSPIYETEPEGYADQGRFLNAVAEGETALTPQEILNVISSIERKLKRPRTIPNGPRTIDIDIIFYGNSVIRTEHLEIPHPRFRERGFVLRPLADLVPDWIDPITGETVRALLARYGER
jgi:2-amino-4-hydroxy-6-hydroxymethyldihydropteridine diphosphokinase